jgi:hypothetical protein
MIGHAGEGIGIFEFLRFDTRCCELGLNESEPNAVPPHCRDNVSPELLLLQPQVEPNRFESCLENLPRGTKYGSHCRAKRHTQKQMRKIGFKQKNFSVGQNVTLTI